MVKASFLAVKIEFELQKCDMIGMVLLELIKSASIFSIVFHFSTFCTRNIISMYRGKQLTLASSSPPTFRNAMYCFTPSIRFWNSTLVTFMLDIIEPILPVINQFEHIYVACWRKKMQRHQKLLDRNWAIYTKNIKIDYSSLCWWSAFIFLPFVPCIFTSF